MKTKELKPTYLVLGRNTMPRRWIDSEPYIKGVSFWKGAKITRSLPTPLAYTLEPLNPDADDHSPYMPSMLGTTIPLVREDLLRTLRKCGVDNLDAYDAAITDPDDGKVYENYKAINILGLVAAADLSKSEYVAHGEPLGDVDFDRLVLNETATKGHLMFRLAESVNAILVHQRIRDRLLKEGFKDLAFRDPEKIAL
jgi:hypothetical protein